MSVEWVDEVPMDRRKQTRYADLLEELKNGAGTWAIVQRVSGKPASTLSQMQQRMKAHGCEAKIRTVDGEVRLYARWPE